MIVVAMKPLSEKTYIDQALKNRHGITWLDDCRVPYQDAQIHKDAQERFISAQGNDLTKQIYTLGIPERKGALNNKGCFPANLLVSDNVLDTGQITSSSKLDGFLIYHQQVVKEYMENMKYYQQKEATMTQATSHAISAWMHGLNKI